MPKRASDADIFQLLTEAKEKKKKKKKSELLKPLELKEFFTEGRISIDKKTCQGVECKLCVKACPTNALFWKAGEVGIIEELCIYCGACVLSCMVDDCIKIARKRPNGEIERFSKPKDFAMLQQSVSAKKRLERTQSIFPKPEDYLKRYSTKKVQKDPE